MGGENNVSHSHIMIAPGILRRVSMTVNRQLLLTVAINVYDSNGSQTHNFEKSRHIEDIPEDNVLHNGLSTTITTENKVLNLGDAISITSQVTRGAPLSSFTGARGTISLLIELDV